MINPRPRAIKIKFYHHLAAALSAGVARKILNNNPSTFHLSRARIYTPTGVMSEFLTLLHVCQSNHRHGGDDVHCD